MEVDIVCFIFCAFYGHLDSSLVLRCQWCVIDGVITPQPVSEAGAALMIELDPGEAKKVLSSGEAPRLHECTWNCSQPCISSHFFPLLCLPVFAVKTLVTNGQLFISNTSTKKNRYTVKRA